MAVRNLVEGQCGESNPLMRLTHHITRDKAYSDEGLQWMPHVVQDGNKGGLAATYGIPAVDQLVEEFMSETQLTPASVPQPFRMDALLQEMREIENSRGPPLLGPAIADLTASQSAGAWAEEYLASEAQLRQGGCDGDGGEWEGLERDQSRQNNSLTSPDEFLEISDARRVPHYLPYPNQYYSNAIHPQARMEDFIFQQHTQHLQHQQNIDSREDSELARTANELLGTVDDPKFSQTEFMQFIRKLSEGSEPSSKEQQKGHSSSATPQAASVSDQVEDSSQQASAAAAAWSGPVGADNSTQDREQQLHERWAEEFMNKKSGSGGVEDVDVDSGNLSPGHREQFWAQLEKQWQQLAEDDELHENSWAREYENIDDNTFKPYQFTEDNPLATHPDPLSEGKRCLAAGDLPSAVLLFEAAAQQQPQLTEAWYLLGTAHAENEQDEKAIPALRKCLELSSDHGDAWMALAACYHNESLQSFACAALKEWLRSNSEYRDLVMDMGAKEGASAEKFNFSGTFASKEVIDEVESLYLRAANSGGVAVDPWVQCGLGVIYNITMDYDRAADCYRAAIAVAPEEPRFWNKLGATLANGSHPEEAVSAYERALELSPGFIRCRFNLGIACMHMNAYKAAVEHFLSALQLQAAGRGLSGRATSSSAVSDNIWYQLRLCLHPLGLTRLKPSVENRDLAALTAALEEVTSS